MDLLVVYLFEQDSQNSTDPGIRLSLPNGRREALEKQQSLQLQHEMVLGEIKQCGELENVNLRHIM